MQAVGQWAFSLCVTAIFCSVVLLLSPSSRLKKSLKFACVLLYTLAFCLPLTQISCAPEEIRLPAEESDYLSPQENFRSGMEFLILNLLREHGIPAEAVTVTLREDGTPTVRLTLSDPSQLQTALLLIQSTYGIPAAP